MSVLTTTIGTQDTVLLLDTPLANAGPYPWPMQIDSETVHVTGGRGTRELSVSRGMEGTTPAAHSIGATVAAPASGGGLPTGWTEDGADPANVATNGARVKGDLTTVNGTALELQAGLGATAYLYGAIGGAAAAGGEVAIIGGGGDQGAQDAAELRVDGGGASIPGKLQVYTAGSAGAAGQALVGSGGSGSAARTVWGSIIVAAGVPSGAPDGKLPIAYDTTAVSGGTYLWNGSDWVKVATIL